MSNPRVVALHNRQAGKIVRQIIMPTQQAGGKASDAMVLLESVIAGVALMIARPGGGDALIDIVAARAKQRFAELELVVRPPEGSA